MSRLRVCGLGMICPTPRHARLYFLTSLLFAIVMACCAAWEVQAGTTALAVGTSCGLGGKLAQAAQVSGSVYLWLALVVGVSSLWLLFLACCDVFCCTELLAALLHAADLGGQAYAPLATPFNWGARIRAEFRSQVALERALRLPPTLAMRGLASDASYAQSQVQFLDELAAPLWRALHAVVGGLEEPLANIAATRAAFAAQA